MSFGSIVLNVKSLFFFTDKDSSPSMIITDQISLCIGLIMHVFVEEVNVRSNTFVHHMPSVRSPLISR